MEGNCVPDLIAKSALQGQGALTMCGTTLAPVDLGTIASVAVFAGRLKAVSAALKPLGFGFPAPGQTFARGDARIVWTGPEQAFLIGAQAPDFKGAAAVTDQSGGWSALRVSGPILADVMARLCPLDFRPLAFPPGRAARAQLGHMNAVFWAEDDALMILTFRSMARNAFDEIAHAMTALAARAGG